MARRRRAPPPRATCPHCGFTFRAGRLACPECGSDARTGWRSAEDIDYESIELPEEGERAEGAIAGRPGSVAWLAAVLLVAALVLAMAFGAF